MLVLLIAACELPEDADPVEQWRIADLAIVPDALNYAEVSGTVELVDGLPGGTVADVRYYSDAYETLVAASSEPIGVDLDEPGVQAFGITHLSVYVVPALGGYELVCAEFRAADSDVAEWVEVGCAP